MVWIQNCHIQKFSLARFFSTFFGVSMTGNQTQDSQNLSMLDTGTLNSNSSQSTSNYQIELRYKVPASSILRFRQFQIWIPNKVSKTVLEKSSFEDFIAQLFWTLGYQLWRIGSAFAWVMTFYSSPFWHVVLQ